MYDLVNVIIPCYNAEQYIEKCLDSIIANNYPNLNVVCVNDGSTDATLSILKKYSADYDYIHIITQNNKGPSAARNVGLDYIEYDDNCFVAFIDSDDWVDPDYFLSMVKLAKKYDADIICACFYFENKKKKNRAYTLKNDDIVLGSYQGLTKLFDDREINSMSHHKLFKTCLWGKLRFPEDLFFLEDTATVFKTFIYANKILLSNYCGYHYNQENNNSIMKNISNNKIISGWKALLSLFEYNYCSYCVYQEGIIKQKVINLLSDNFLELYPRFDVRMNKNDLITIKKYIKRHKIIRRFIPQNKKQKIKKVIYLLFPYAYRLLFKCYIKVIK